ncbi:hypothetical protein CapIbe_024254, partial [Capra ibex]
RSLYFSCRWVLPDDRGRTSFLFFWFHCLRGDPMVNMKFIWKPRLWSPPSPSSPANLHHLLPSWLPVGASSFLPHIRGTSSLMEAPGPGLEDADMVPLLLHPETLHSLKLTPTPRPQDHSTDLTCRVNLQGSQMPRGTSTSASPSETSQPSRFCRTPHPFSSQRARHRSCCVLLTATPLHS